MRPADKAEFTWYSIICCLDATLIWSSCHNLILSTHRLITAENLALFQIELFYFHLDQIHTVDIWESNFRYVKDCQSGISKLQVVITVLYKTFLLLFQVPGGLTVCVRWTWWVSSRNTWPSSPVGGTGGVGPSSHSPPPLGGRGPSQRTTGHSCNTS